MPSGMAAAPAVLLRLDVVVRMQRPGICVRGRSAVILVGILPAISSVALRMLHLGVHARSRRLAPRGAF